MVFSFIKAPTGQGLSDNDFIVSALEQPMSFGATAFTKAQGEFLESYGAGSIIRPLSVPKLADPDFEPSQDYVEAGTDPRVRRARQQRVDAYQPPMSEEEYKQSRFYRDDLKFEQGLTPARAEALANQYDAQKTRDFYAQKRPIAAFIGGLVGQALDPINYIPIFGESVVAANVGRFGVVGGRALTSSADAIANTAIFGALSYPIREKMGDDITWQSTISELAMAGLIGGAFGSIHGLVGARKARLQLEAREKLATLKNVQASRVALNDAIDGMAKNGEVVLSEASEELVQEVANVDVPRVSIDRISRDMAPEKFDRLDTLDQVYETNAAEIDRLQAEMMDNERFGPTRAKMIEADQIATKIESLQESVQRASSDKERSSIGQQVKKQQNRLREALKSIDDAEVQEIERLDDALAARRLAQEKVIPEREAIQAETDQIRKQASKQYWDAAIAEERAKPKVKQPVKTEPEAQAEVAAQKVEQTAKRPEATPEMAEQFRVDPETGNFAEMDELDVLIAEGRVTEEELATLAQADEVMTSAKAYSEAVKSFAGCAI